jgi:hypothetical protein
VRVLADVGLGFVFLLASYEIDLWLFREGAGRWSPGRSPWDWPRWR